jgi:outer membrane lipoprotein-sorting protein
LQSFKVSTFKLTFHGMKAPLKALFLGILAISTLWAKTASAQIVGESPALEHALAQMDAAAKNFKTTEASVVWDQYQKVINETETEKGRIYFRREGDEIQMAADFAEPDKKYVVYSGGKVQVYQPKIDQVNEYSPGKNRSDVESFLVLGFGGSGRDLYKSYGVRFVATETVGGIAASKLELIPKSDRLRNNIARIWLWIDPARGISVQQQFFEPDGDYRLAKYSDIKINQKLPEEVFKLKTTRKTKFVSPQG